ncbi:MAG TPA: universal stress protein [Marmoricola sp.]|nr:universal stress protein [Marmoricola sp.]
MTDQVITVGVDGSKSSADALRFAIEEARLRGATVRAVTSWQLDTVYAGYGGALLPEESAAHEKAATELQDRAILSVVRDLHDVPLIERRVVRGHPGQALVEYSRDAAMLVVGTEHKGVVKRAVVGSTSAYCSRYSRVPVVVVPFVDAEVHGLSD